MDTIRISAYGTETHDDTYVIFSVDNWNKPSDSYNFEKVLAYEDMKHKVNTKKLIGCWQGVLENSYITTLDQFNRLRAYGYMAEQECFLKIIMQGNHALTYDLDTGEYLGRMESVPGAFAIQQEGWTYHPEQQKYYVIL